MNEISQKYFNQNFALTKKIFNIDLLNNHNINNCHKNKRCFILGTAPTIDGIDLGKINNEITFGLNSIVSFFIPKYFVAISNGAFIPEENLISACKAELLFLNFSLLKQIENISTKLNYQYDINKFFIYFADNPRKNIISPILKQIKQEMVTVCNGSSCLFPALQFARVMGCNPIYLVGIVMKDNGGEHSYCNNSLKKKSISAFNVSLALKTMEKIVKEYEQDGIKIISATPNCLFVDRMRGASYGVLTPVVSHAH